MGQGIATTQFYLYGKKHCTKTGYLKKVKSYDSPVQNEAAIGIKDAGADGVDLTGKVIMVTGANSGIGKEIATYAAAKGANLYMLCRSKERAEAARDEIAKLTSNDQIKIILADLGIMSQVRDVVKDFQSREQKLDCLVCNAGILYREKQLTAEGNEATFASHLLGGSYLLSTLLYPQLRAAGTESRVAFVSSGGMYNSNFPSWDVATNEKGKYWGDMAYSYAKRGQVLLAERWTRDRPDVCWLSCHPGWVGTNAVDLAYGSNKKYLEPMRSIWQGAEGITWLMSTKRENLESGGFYLDRTPRRKHIAGAFMSDGSYTKNSEKEVDEMMENLKKAAGL